MIVTVTLLLLHCDTEPVVVIVSGTVTLRFSEASIQISVDLRKAKLTNIKKIPLQ